MCANDGTVIIVFFKLIYTFIPAFGSCDCETFSANVFDLFILVLILQIQYMAVTFIPRHATGHMLQAPC